jgi:hypothetical protein
MVPSLAQRRAEDLPDRQGGDRAGQIGEAAPGESACSSAARISFRSAINGSRPLLVPLPLRLDRRTDSGDALEILVLARHRPPTMYKEPTAGGAREGWSLS